MAKIYCMKKKFKLKNFKNLQKFNSKKKTQLKKWTVELSSHFSEESMQMGDKHMKRFFESLVIWEMQIKSIMNILSHLEAPSSLGEL